MLRRLAVWLLGIGWLCAVTIGEGGLLRYELSPGSPAAPGPNWPGSSSLSRTSEVFNLLVFAHPRCPCTRATIRELARLVAQCPNRLAAKVLFFEPPQAKAEWAETDLWRAAAAIPGVTIVRDKAGIEAERFGARTSGQVLLYDLEGRLRFRGGITPSRGHEGANLGGQAICAIVLEDAHAFAESPVFGCSLVDPCSITQEAP